MDSALSNFQASLPQLLDPLLAIGILLLSFLVALGFYKILFPRLVGLLPWKLEEPNARIAAALRLPLTLCIIGGGGFLALTLPLELAGRPVATALSFMGIVLGVIGGASLVSNLLVWYIEGLAPRDRSGAHARLVPLIQRGVMILVYLLGGLLALDLLNINVTPLIAGLGIGGLAGALALQPTLSNLFAGTYVMTEGVITPGDFVELENGPSGYVLEVSWRSTRIRSLENNLVLVPNSRFAETIVTNYHQPDHPVNILLTGGVSLDSDFYQVEQICREVMDEVMSTNPNAVPDAVRTFGLEEFGESNVSFFFRVQAIDRIARIALRTALMQRLRERFRGEGIVINYPVRNLRFPGGVEASGQGTIKDQTSLIESGAGGGPTLTEDEERLRAGFGLESEPGNPI